ncbi:hypothetical protein QTP70_012118 [Hemibagrus guttatus]|uniref:CAP-Gly domain-containing protein n=1 Tax=Hemibagrus guttatus TaxID=175788 RepID=A0AAE0V6H2_9TELE|nr:hypothetical protein QTP70_012118 [Hemibagrus guttatus]
MVVCRMTLMVCKKKRSKIELEKKTKWWKLKKEECCEEFRQKLRQALGGQVVLPDDWETTDEVIRETGRKVLGVSSGRRKEDKETCWWNEEVQDSIQRKRLAKKKWHMDRTEENRQEYKELQHRVKREVSKAKQKAYDELYTRLDTREGQKDLYRLARQRDRDGKDVQQVRVIKDRDGRVLTNLEKAYDRVPREELWYCMRKSGVAEKYVRVVQDMYERSRTVVRCAVVMDQLSEEVRQESPWTMMFADDIVICSESREQVEENLERWRFALERRGMKVSRSMARSRTPSACSSVSDGPMLRLGERVLVIGQRTGVVRFYGKTSFAPGIWLGIELDKPSGKNDGSVGGVKYFSCPPKHGVFAPPSRVQRYVQLTPPPTAMGRLGWLLKMIVIDIGYALARRIHGSVDCLSELSSSRYNHTLTGMRRSLSTTSAIATQREPNRKTQANRNHLSSTRRRWNSLSSASAAASPRGSGTLGGTVSSSGTDGAVKLHLGMQVLLSSANEMGTIRYFGTADFAPGLWLGLELRNAKGKNDGSVGSRRYFSCRPLHGVLVRPSRVTYRGINGAKLVDESS